MSKHRKMYSEKTSFWTYLAQFLILIFVFIPILWGIRTSLCASTFDISFIPKKISLANYGLLITSGGFLNAMKNSLIYSVGTLCVLLPVIILAAYALARMHFKGKKIVKTILLLIPLLPSIALLIPLSQELNVFGLLNNRWGVILLNVTFQSCFTCWMMRNFFTSLPVSVEEAAYIDGCSKLKSLVLIVLPNAVTGIVSVVVYSFISSWLSYLIPYMVVSKSEYFSLPQNLLFLQGQYGTNYPKLCAASILTLIPPMVFFCFFQKWFIRGLFGVSTK